MARYFNVGRGVLKNFNLEGRRGQLVRISIWMGREGDGYNFDWEGWGANEATFFCHTDQSFLSTTIKYALQ